MSPSVSHHPDRGQLERFSLGQLPAAEAQPIEAHLIDCTTCCAALAQFPGGGDAFLSRLQSAYTDPGRDADTGVIRDAAPASRPADQTSPDAYHTIINADAAQILSATPAPALPPVSPTELRPG